MYDEYVIFVYNINQYILCILFVLVTGMTLQETYII